MRAALALAFVTIGAAAVAGPGRVVRVERAHGILRTPRICTQLQANGVGTCWGKAPIVGETASVLDPQSGVLGELRIAEVTPQLDTCGKVQRWEFRYTVESGSLDKVQWGSSLALFDIEVRRGRSQLLATDKSRPPDQRMGEQVFALVDRDGDGNGDLISTAYMCDKNGDPRATLPSVGYCIDYWDLVHGDWRMIRHDFVETCLN